MKWTIPLLLGGLLGLFVACGPQGGAAASGNLGNLPEDDGSVGGISEVPNPTPAMAQASGTPLETLQHGHATYMLKCAECHVYMLPDDLFVDEWQDTVPEMVSHAGLPPNTEQAVLAYILAVKKTD